MCVYAWNSFYPNVFVEWDAKCESYKMEKNKARDLSIDHTVWGQSSVDGEMKGEQWELSRLVPAPSSPTIQLNRWRRLLEAHHGSSDRKMGKTSVKRR